MTDDTASELVRSRLEESIEVKRRLLEQDGVDFVTELAAEVVAALRNGGKVLFIGNGGSAADASHLAAEFVGRYLVDRAPLPAITMMDNAAAMSAIANDYGYAETLTRQVRALGRDGDVMVAMSTSGESENVIRAVETANSMALHTAALTGASGGRLALSAERCLRVPSDETPRIQEAHILVGHLVCELVERQCSSHGA